MITDYTDKRLWKTSFETLGGKTPEEFIASEGNRTYVFEAYIKGAYGERLMANMLPG